MSIIKEKELITHKEKSNEEHESGRICGKRAAEDMAKNDVDPGNMTDYKLE